MIYLLQTVIGVLGNSSLLYHFLFLYFTGCRLRPINLILKHLIGANLLSLLCKGVPYTVVAFGGQVSPGDVGCKLLFYLHRVGRGVSIGSICFLSVFQAIVISSREARWANLKGKVSKNVGFFLCPIWVLYSLVNVIFLIYITGSRHKENITNLQDFGYCYSIHHDKHAQLLHAVLLSLPDALCLELMLWASSSMVFTLYRHKQQMRYMHRTNVSPSSSPESRATKTILLLVSTYVCFYTLSCIFQVYLSLTYNPSWYLVSTTAIVSVCFPSVSPFLLMSSDTNACRSCFACVRNKNSPDLLKNMWKVLLLLAKGRNLFPGGFHCCVQPSQVPVPAPHLRGLQPLGGAAPAPALTPPCGVFSREFEGAWFGLYLPSNLSSKLRTGQGKEPRKESSVNSWLKLRKPGLGRQETWGFAPQVPRAPRPAGTSAPSLASSSKSGCVFPACGIMVPLCTKSPCAFLLSPCTPSEVAEQHTLPLECCKQEPQSLASPSVPPDPQRWQCPTPFCARKPGCAGEAGAGEALEDSEREVYL
ncbi:vomeronasal type-1 receptor 4-like [Octodon degus]|uniref:Vomeronasal type-1 receptor 4-like n=1 Tax=Octodon degus TaxID=10160 RepID=A0A6P3FDW2_OCTDE|nr:vomeronasal type-1 receptor 4-like [Octodon degus]